MRVLADEKKFMCRQCGCEFYPGLGPSDWVHVPLNRIMRILAVDKYATCDEIREKIARTKMENPE